MASNNHHNDQIIACLRTLRETIDKLQDLLGSPAEASMERMYRRRRELLTRLYASGGLDQKALFALLDEHETPHQWIGQQVKSGYIEKFPRPSGKDIYVATHKAVEDLNLQEEASALVSATDETFTTDWDSTEDAAYDRL